MSIPMQGFSRLLRVLPLAVVIFTGCTTPVSSLEIQDGTKTKLKKCQQQSCLQILTRLYGTRYREAWRLAEALRARRGKDGFADWPNWCYVPAWYDERHIVAEGRASFPLERR